MTTIYEAPPRWTKAHAEAEARLDRFFDALTTNRDPALDWAWIKTFLKSAREAP